MKRIGIGWLALAAVALVSATTTVHVAGGRTHGTITTAPRQLAPAAGIARTADKPRFPSAAEFAHAFVGTTNQFAAEHGDPTRISQPHCVQASPGHYMCSYVAKRPRVPRRCYLMQARWTPQKASTITITLAGRTARCGSLREAIDSLQ
jgi:hypothetical protein